MKTNERGLEIIKRFEGSELEAFLRPPDTRWTVGVGHTRGVHPGMKITVEQRDAFLSEDLQVAEYTVAIGVGVPLTSNEFSALVSLVFNIGPGKKGERDGFLFQKSGEPSTIRQLLNADLKASAAQEFLRWKFCNGQILRGLVERRRAEQELFLQLPTVP